MTSVALDIVRDVDDLLVRVGTLLVNRVAAKRRVPPYYVALGAPGLCHCHLPDDRVRPDCAFCRRRGALVLPPS